MCAHGPGHDTLAALDEPVVALSHKLMGHLPRGELRTQPLLENVREPLAGTAY